MTLGSKQRLFACLVPRLIDHIYNNGCECTFGDAYRDNRVEYGHPNSMHKKRLAIDLNLFKDGKYLTDSNHYLFAGEYWKNLNDACNWDIRDGNHFSMFANDYGMEF